MEANLIKPVDDEGLMRGSPGICSEVSTGQIGQDTCCFSTSLDGCGSMFVELGVDELSIICRLVIWDELFNGIGQKVVNKNSVQKTLLFVKEFCLVFANRVVIRVEDIEEAMSSTASFHSS